MVLGIPQLRANPLSLEILAVGAASCGAIVKLAEDEDVHPLELVAVNV